MSIVPARSAPPSAGRFVVLLALVVATLLGMRWLLQPDHAHRNFEYMPDMSVSLALESQSISGALPSGYSQQALVAGVVPRGTHPFRYGPGDDEAKRAGRELSSPFAADDEAAGKRGAEVFRVHCMPCHDAAGGGQGAAVLRGMLPPPPLQGANAMQMPDGEMFHVIAMGRGNMPAMRTRLSATDRWSAILHIRALQTAKPVAPPIPDEAIPDEATPDEATPPGDGKSDDSAPRKEEDR